MKRSTLLATAAALMTVGAAAPAMADYVRLGSVDVGYRMDKDTKWNRFGGGMEGLRLEADGNDVACTKIVAHFADGTQQNVFSGKLREGRPVVVDLKGGTRRVSDIALTCRSDQRNGAKVYIAAEIGRFQNDWMKSPDWALFWSRLFHWTMPAGRDDKANWVTISREDFGGRKDNAKIEAGAAGRAVDRLGFRAMNDDARCTKVRVTFGSGKETDLDVGRLEQGRIKSMDLPGEGRTVAKIAMNCSPTSKRAVSIEVTSHKH